MEERKWEDLEMDCLVNVLGRVGMQSLLLDVPFVCKSWHKASINPSCWRHLVFPIYALHPWYNVSLKERFIEVYGINKLSDSAFVKFIINRSCRNATVLALPDFCTEEALKYAADECPSLEMLVLSSLLCHQQSSIILKVIGKWKNLEGLSLADSSMLVETLSQISLNCEKFWCLKVSSNRYIGKAEVSAIVTLLPEIKHLYLRGTYIERQNLITLLKGCEEIVYLDVSDCVGFEVDGKILELASHIKTFKYKDSRLFDYDDTDEGIDHDDLDGYFSS